MKKFKVTIVDYGLGNILSVKRGLERCGGDVFVSSSPEEIMHAERLVLPGVGAFPKGIRLLEEKGLTSSLQDYSLQGRPLLGVCLGMQLLFESSDEFTQTMGLGIFRGNVVPIANKDNSGEKIRVPHIGWSPLVGSGPKSTWSNSLLKSQRYGSCAYFVHSYKAEVSEQGDLIAYTLYSDEKIPAVVNRGTIYGTQFHPEKSGEVGLGILRNFLHL